MRYYQTRFGTFGVNWLALLFFGRLAFLLGGLLVLKQIILGE